MCEPALGEGDGRLDGVDHRRSLVDVEDMPIDVPDRISAEYERANVRLQVVVGLGQDLRCKVRNYFFAGDTAPPTLSANCMLLPASAAVNSVSSSVL